MTKLSMKKSLLARILSAGLTLGSASACGGGSDMPDAGIDVPVDTPTDSGTPNGCEEELIRRGVSIDVIDAENVDSPENQICNATVTYENADGTGFTNELTLLGGNCRDNDSVTDTYVGITQPGTYVLTAIAPMYQENSRTVTINEDDCGHLVTGFGFIALQPVPRPDAGPDVEDAGQQEEDAGVSYDGGMPNVDAGSVDAGTDTETDGGSQLEATCESLSEFPACLNGNGYIVIGEEASPTDQWVADLYAAKPNFTRINASDVVVTDDDNGNTVYTVGGQNLKGIIYGDPCSNSLQAGPEPCNANLVENQSNIALDSSGLVNIVGYGPLERKTALDVLDTRADELTGTAYKVIGQNVDSAIIAAPEEE